MKKEEKSCKKCTIEKKNRMLCGYKGAAKKQYSKVPVEPAQDKIQTIDLSITTQGTFETEEQRRITALENKVAELEQKLIQLQLCDCTLKQQPPKEANVFNKQSDFKKWDTKDNNIKYTKSLKNTPH